ncbi:MAG: hypothetical protein QM627_00045 [Luteolibacter sp.]
MNRYFKAPAGVFAAIRETLRNDLEQPNGNADEPMREHGDFIVGDTVYQALAEHHTTGFFAPYLPQFLAIPGVEEISAAEYLAAKPEPEEEP